MGFFRTWVKWQEGAAEAEECSPSMGKISWQEGRETPWPKQQGRNSLVLPVALPCTHGGQPPWGKNLGLCTCLNGRRATPSALGQTCRRNAKSYEQRKGTQYSELIHALAEGASVRNSEFSAKVYCCFPSYRELYWAIRYSKQLFLPCLWTLLPSTDDAMEAWHVCKSGGQSSLHKKGVSIAETEQQLFLCS